MSLLQPGQLLDGRYRIVRKLGSGATSVVFLATDTTSGIDVAVKELHLKGRRHRTRFEREAAALTKITHPNVVRILAHYSDPPSLVMELLPNLTLSDRHGADPRLAESVTRDIAAALQAVHAAGMIHRDIKPQNIALSGPTAVLFDFGLVRDQSSSLTAPGEVLGTLNYLAPESILGEKVTSAVDIFGLGAVLYELVTGEPRLRPSLREPIREYVSRVLTSPAPAPVCSYNPVLTEIIRAALSPDHRNRPTAGDILQAIR